MKLAFDWVLPSQQRHIVSELIVGGDDRTLPVRVVLRSTRTAKDLQDVENAQINEGTFLGIVDLSTLRRERWRERENIVQVEVKLIHTGDFEEVHVYAKAYNSHR